MIYLGKLSVGVSLKSGINVIPLNTTENGIYTPESGYAYGPVNVAILQGIPILVVHNIDPITNQWVRPIGWPDLDHVTLNNNTDIDELYLTYDLDKTPGYGWIGIYATTSNNSSFTVERGHLSNNVFVADATYSTNSGYCFRLTLDNTNGTILLWRVSGYHITKYGFVPNSETSSKNYQNNLQPCVEIGGRLSFITSLASNDGTGSTTYHIGTVWLENFGVDMDTSAVTTMNSMFYHCHSLQSLNASDWDTSAVTTMANMFFACHSLQSLNINNWNTSAVTSMASMFYNCYSLQSLDVSKWDTSAVTNMGAMFYNCYSLQSLDVSEWDTSAVTSMNSMFFTCYSLQSLDVSDWDTSAVTSMASMFSGCYNLLSLNISKWDTSVVISMSNMFYNCYSLQSLNMSGLDTSKVTGMSSMFFNCYNLQSLDAEGIDLTRLTSGLPAVNLSQLQDYKPFIISQNLSFGSALQLTPASLLRIINSLPTVSSTKTLSLGQSNKLKLTAEQIAIATQKGWTVP